MIVSHQRIAQEFHKWREFLSHEDALRKTAEQLFMLESDVEKIIGESN